MLKYYLFIYLFIYLLINDKKFFFRVLWGVCLIIINKSLILDPYVF